MWIDDDLIFPMEKKFGALYRDTDFSFPKYPFYADGEGHNGADGIEMKHEFELKFVRHFKYNQIAYDSVEMFSEHFADIMYVNYPKYRHYWEVVKKAKDLKWWNNKDFKTIFEGSLDRKDSNDIIETIERLDKLVKTLEKKGTVDDYYSRELREKTLETGRNDVNNVLEKSGTNTSEMTKGTIITTDFMRALSSTEKQNNSDESTNVTKSTNSSKNDSASNTSDESTSNSTNKNLDTPQGTINNLIDNVNAYMTTATVDSSRDTDKSNTTTTGTSSGESSDITTNHRADKKDIVGTETGTTKNTESSSGSDTKTDTLGEKQETNISDEKVNNTTLDKTGNALDKKTYDTTDTTTRIVTDKDKTTTQEKGTRLDKEKFTKTEEGNIGVTSAGQLVNDWLKFGYINIEKMMIRDCEKLFLQVY